jgi:hypothetical protein
MLKQIPIVLAVLLLVVAALKQGTDSERWSTFPELDVYAKHLEAVPMDVGEWRGEEGTKIDDRSKQVAGVVGAVNRKYVNATLNETVSVDLVSGRPHDMFFHTPDRCYPAAGFERGGKQTQVKIDGVEGSFYTNTYIKSESSGIQNLRIYWAWSTDGTWTAPESFKWKYGGNPSIYKLYVMVPITSHDQSEDRNGATDFLRVFVPELKKTLFAKANLAPAAATPAETDPPAATGAPTATGAPAATGAPTATGAPAAKDASPPASGKS